MDFFVQLHLCSNPTTNCSCVADSCLTVEGATEAERHREYYTGVLEYVYGRISQRLSRASSLHPSDLLGMLKRVVEVNQFI